MAGSTNDDWRADCVDIVAIQNKARHESRFTDIQFSMKQGEIKRIFNVHKLILACGSPVFEAMFYGTLAEKRDIIETDDDPEAFEMLLDYFYGKSITLTSMVSAGKYFTIGDKYLVPKIQEKAKEYVMSVSLNEDSFWKLIQKNLYLNPLFVDKVDSYLMSNTRSIIASELSLNLPEIVINNILQMDILDLSEYELLTFVTKWACKNIARTTSVDFLEFYKHIRFSLLTFDEFFQFTTQFAEVIDAKSCLGILHYLRNATDYNLPTWCSVSKKLRSKQCQSISLKNKIKKQQLCDNAYCSSESLLSDRQPNNGLFGNSSPARQPIVSLLGSSSPIGHGFFGLHPVRQTNNGRYGSSYPFT